MSKLILGIGLPGSGKSTALKPFAEKVRVCIYFT
jgi:dephospho-CoA kinase